MISKDPNTNTTPVSAAEPEISYQILSVTYSSPNNENFEHLHKLPTSTSNKVSDRIAYLATLQKATVDMQERINKELTARMEEDKLREAGHANGLKVNDGKIDEAKEEDNYGEEVLEDED